MARSNQGVSAMSGVGISSANADSGMSDNPPIAPPALMNFLLSIAEFSIKTQTVARFSADG
jgi:hypothetical protein